MATSRGNTHDRALQQGYLDLSQAEFDEADYWDSDTFAERSMAAGRGESVQPEAISARDLPADRVGTLTAARERLSTALAGGAAQRDPAQAAEAQVAFDCWMQEQEEDIQPDHIAACRDRFMTAMASLEARPPVAAPPGSRERPMSTASKIPSFKYETGRGLTSPIRPRHHNNRTAIAAAGSPGAPRRSHARRASRHY